jgi:hypothetical protein
MSDEQLYEAPKVGETTPGMWCDQCVALDVERKPNGSFKVWTECTACKGWGMYRLGL